MLEDAEKEVHMVEQEARRALEENNRYCMHLVERSIQSSTLYSCTILRSLSNSCSFFFILRARDELQNVPAIMVQEYSSMQSESQDYIGIRV